VRALELDVDDLHGTPDVVANRAPRRAAAMTSYGDE
jgi:hypothetical protein